MEKLLYNISQVLGITIIHSLWQGLMVYMVLRLVFLAFPALKTPAKYNLLSLGLMGISLWFAYTFFTEAQNYNWGIDRAYSNFNLPVNSINPLASPGHNSFAEDYKAYLYHTIKSYLPYLSVIYIVGLVINLSRLGLAGKKIYFIRQNLVAANSLQQQANEFASSLSIKKYVQVSFNQLVNVPCVIGYFKPILLLPVTLTTQLSAKEIESILLHELSHIKNNDYLFNLIQQVLVVLLFFNPFAQFISRMISDERENRCDDIVLQITGSPLTYANALVKLEEARLADMPLALAATGNKSNLFKRIQRMMKANKPVVNMKHLLLAMIIFIGSLGSIAWLNPEIKNGRIVSKRGTQAVSKLVAMVKGVVAQSEPVNIEPTQTAQNRLDSSVNKKGMDTVKQSVATVAIDTSIKARQVALLKLLSQISTDLQTDQVKRENQPEYKKFMTEYKVLDSMRKIKGMYQYPPELLQRKKDDKEAWDDFYKSPEQQAKVAEDRRLTSRYFTLLHSKNEWKQAYNEWHSKKDSITKVFMLKTGLTEQQLQQNKEYMDTWHRTPNKLNLIEIELENSPELKPIFDSMQTSTRNIYNGPAFKALNDKTRWKDEEMAAVKKAPELDKQEGIVREARTVMQNTPEYKKYMTDAKKYDDILDEIRSIKLTKP